MPDAQNKPQLMIIEDSPNAQRRLARLLAEAASKNSPVVCYPPAERPPTERPHLNVGRGMSGSGRMLAASLMAVALASHPAFRHESDNPTRKAPEDRTQHDLDRLRRAEEKRRRKLLAKQPPSRCPHCLKQECDCSDADVAPDMGAR